MDHEDQTETLNSLVNPHARHLAGKTVWVLTDGKLGMENQCLGLA